MAEDDQNWVPAEEERSSSESEVHDDDNDMLSGTAAVEYDDATLILIDYLFCAIKAQMMHQLDSFMVKQIHDKVPITTSMEETLQLVGGPMSEDAGLMSKMIHLLFHTMKSKILKDFDDFLLMEIEELLCADLGDADDLSPGGDDDATVGADDAEEAGAGEAGGEHPEPGDRGSPAPRKIPE